MSDPENPQVDRGDGHPAADGASLDLSSASAPGVGHDKTENGSTVDSGVESAAGSGQLLLFTPAQAAGFLQVRESWLRRRAAARRVPCSFLGKHLRFSAADLALIVRAASTEADGPARRNLRARRGR